MADNERKDESDEQHVHPHWRAIASVSFRPKIFVKSSGNEDERNLKTLTQKQLVEAGESASGFYKEVIEMPSTSKIQSPPVSKKRKQFHKKTKVERLPFEKEKLFRLAMRNKTEEILNLIDNSTDVDLDATDSFGWTALMMAACENALDSFLLLLAYGADLSIKDRSGNSAASLAQKKNHIDILSAIEEHQKRHYAHESSSDDNEEKQEERNGTDFCPDCKIEISKKSSKSHQSSTVHLFSCKYNTDSVVKSFGIAHSNRGYQMMKTIGWDGNSALGARKDGKLYPIKTVLRHKRTGLGIKQADAKITHFKAHDVSAVHYKSQPRVPTRKEILEQVEKDKRKERMLRRELS